MRVRGYGLDLEAPAMDYAQHLLGHPAVTRWVDAGIAEPWVDEPHEADCIRGRRVIEDRRG